MSKACCSPILCCWVAHVFALRILQTLKSSLSDQSLTVKPQSNLSPQEGKEKRKADVRPATSLMSHSVHQWEKRLTGIGGPSSCSCHFACALVSCSHSDSDWNSCRRSPTCMNTQRWRFKDISRMVSDSHRLSLLQIHCVHSEKDWSVIPASCNCR